MSIQSFVNNTTSTVGDFFSSTFTQAKSAIDNIVGTASTGLSNLYSGGFVGMSEEGMQALNTAVDQYCQTIESQINEFNDEADNSNAYAGEISTAVHEYCEAMKKLLTAYVSTMRKEQEDAVTAYNTFHEAEKSFAQQATSDSQEITSNAENIRQESTTLTLE